jgi:non-heme Fe2+,alpha-ketoglutarate-dependent halogenase
MADTTDMVPLMRALGRGDGPVIGACPEPWVLFCFPFAGGAAGAYRPLARYLPADVELCSGQLPGRQDLARRPSFRDLREAVAALADEVEERAAPRFAFFGHSMGAVLAFEVARELRRRGSPGPGVLGVSAAAAPQLRERARVAELAGDSAGELLALGGIPGQMLRRPELAELHMRTLRADVRLLRHYRYRHERALDVALAVFGGATDPLVPLHALAGWRELVTERGRNVRVFAGGHFFLWGAAERVMATLVEAWRTSGAVLMSLRRRSVPMANRANFTLNEPDSRDLSFRAANVAAARALTPEQVSSYNASGFVTGLPVFDAADIAELRAYVSRLVDDAVAQDDGRDSYSINAYHLTCRRLYDVISAPRILDYVTDIIGPDIVCWGTTVFCKLPHDRKAVPLHQDAAYWPFTPTRSVTVWLAIDDADAANGAMEFAPGSHLLGLVEHADYGLDETKARGREAVGPASYPQRYVNVLSAGQVSLHSDLLLHGSAANPSDRRRTGLTLRYAAGDVRALPGWEWWYGGAVHCRGTIPGWWPHRQRPRGEHPELMALFGGAGVPDAG